MATHEVSVAFDPASSTFSPIRDDEAYDNATYNIENFGNIEMTPKPDGKIECKIPITLGLNGTA